MYVDLNFVFCKLFRGIRVHPLVFFWWTHVAQSLVFCVVVCPIAILAVELSVFLRLTTSD